MECLHILPIIAMRIFLVTENMTYEHICVDVIFELELFKLPVATVDYYCDDIYASRTRRPILVVSVVMRDCFSSIYSLHIQVLHLLFLYCTFVIAIVIT